ncbi:hypothetical protein [Brucella pseudogrignonensis]|uniref:hypothetical protein n=1 Tax=Brucella pseudogrignonensis TaxID=419475 RepID=UPI003D98B814
MTVKITGQVKYRKVVITNHLIIKFMRQAELSIWREHQTNGTTPAALMLCKKPHSREQEKQWQNCVHEKTQNSRLCDQPCRLASYGEMMAIIALDHQLDTIFTDNKI